MEQKNILSGQEFNKLFNTELKPQFYKILGNETLSNNRKFNYSIGLNIDHNEFGDKYGLHFCTKEFIGEYIDYGTHMCLLEIPDDALMIKKSYKEYKANKVIVTNIMKIEESDLWNDMSFCANSAKLNGCCLKYIKPENTTDEMRLDAVRSYDYRSIRFIDKDHLTYELCSEAVKKSKHALRYTTEEFKQNYKHNNVVA
jgi:hypothetical protein